MDKFLSVIGSVHLVSVPSCCMKTGIRTTKTALRENYEEYLVFTVLECQEVLNIKKILGKTLKFYPPPPPLQGEDL